MKRMAGLLAAALAVTAASATVNADPAPQYPGNCSITFARSYCGTGDADDAHRPRRTCYFAGSDTTIYTYGPWTRVGKSSIQAPYCPTGYSWTGQQVMKTEHY